MKSNLSSLNFREIVSRLSTLIVVHRIFVVFTIGTFISILVGSNVTNPVQQIDAASQKTVRDMVCIAWREGEYVTEQKLALGNGDLASTAADPTIQLQGEPYDLSLGVVQENVLKNNKFQELLVSGRNAAGISATSFASRDSAIRRGLAMSSCQPTGQNFWFSGVRTTSGFESFLQLANPDNSDIVVSIKGFTSEGAASLAQFSRVVVPARSTRTVDLTRALPGVEAAAFSLRVADGRIAAVVQMEVVDGVNPRGRTFIQPTVDPRNTLVINGVSPQSTTAELHVLPTSKDAVVTVRVVTADGSFPLSGAEDVLIPESTVRVFDLAKALGGQGATVVVESDQPIVASLNQYVINKSVSDYEISVGQDQVRQLGVLAVPSISDTTFIDVYCVGASNITLMAMKDGKKIWETTDSLSAQSFKRLKIPAELSGKTVLSIVADQPGVYVTAWTYHRTSPGSISAATPIADVIVTSLAGARINLKAS